MSGKKVLWMLLWITVAAGSVHSQVIFKWKPRLLAGIGLVVWSPGGEDKDLFQTSMGLNVTAQYWFKPETAIVISGSYAPLNAREDIWYERLGITQSFDEWNVQGSVWHGAAEIRNLFSAGSRNFMYLGAGVDVFFFGAIEGDYAIYGTEQPTYGTIASDRNPSLTFGPYVTPGMFFLFHSFLGQMFIDVGLQFHYLIDGDSDNPFWLDPSFKMGLRMF